MTLGEYLKEAAGKRFEWGKHDCSTFTAGWIACQVGREIPIPVIASEADAEHLFAEAGGMAELWDSVLRDYAMLCEPGVGAIGLVSMPDGSEIAGICTGERWAFVTDHGLRVTPVADHRIIATWCANG